ncbi:hypothetical protein BGZ91_007221 [Linnemannia elongata]|nr:hypothetical protein BGZ91_007221 [Linnemannia elongata]KAG0064295.1 hypothetical protein BGZ90_002273 [Linnemannia elongata]
MPLKGLHLELLRRDSFKFLEYEDKFGTDTLLKLYKVYYSGTKNYRLRSEEWSSVLYFHGTAHCGCLYIRTQNLNEYNELDEYYELEECKDFEGYNELEEYRYNNLEGYNESNEWKDDRDTKGADDFNREQQQADSVVVVKEEGSMSVVGETRMTRIRVRAQDWCSSTFCPTKGILNFGHRKHLIQRGGGHYFSAYYQTAKFFALQKLGELKTAKYAIQRKNLPMRAEVGLLYSIFICRVRNVCMTGYKYVLNDEDILPCYLAIVRLDNGSVAQPHFEGDKAWRI